MERQNWMCCLKRPFNYNVRLALFILIIVCSNSLRVKIVLIF